LTRKSNGEFHVELKLDAKINEHISIDRKFTDIQIDLSYGYV